MGAAQANTATLVVDEINASGGVLDRQVELILEDSASDDEQAAASLGVRVTQAKRIIFLFAAVGCGAAGAITMINSLSVYPDSIFGIQWTAYMIFMVLLGGLGTFEGPVLGALVRWHEERLTARGRYVMWAALALGFMGADTRRSQVYVLFALASAVRRAGEVPRSIGTARTRALAG